MRDKLFHPWLVVRVQIALGAVFLVAALSKLMDPPGFAQTIWNYQLFPGWSIHPLALFLPWLELICGAALCLGLWVRGAAAWIGLLLLGFITALAINLARHHPVDCGCFGSQAPRSEGERLKDMRWTLFRDLGLFLLAIHILVRKETRCA